MAFVVTQKEYEKPETGEFVGVIVDVVDLGKIKGKFGEKPKVRIVWTLNANDSEGNPFRTAQQVTASMNEKATLFNIIKDVDGEAPSNSYDLDLLIGKSRKLYIKKEKGADGKWYSNIKAIMPLGNLPALAVPANFVRAKDKVQQPGYGQQAAPVTTTQSAPTQAVSTPVDLNAPAVTGIQSSPQPVATAEEKF